MGWRLAMEVSPSGWREANCFQKGWILADSLFQQAEPSWAQALIAWLDSADENKSTFEVC